MVIVNSSIVKCVIGLRLKVYSIFVFKCNLIMIEHYFIAC